KQSVSDPCQHPAPKTIGRNRPMTDPLNVASHGDVFHAAAVQHRPTEPIRQNAARHGGTPCLDAVSDDSVQSNECQQLGGHQSHM
ncbi:MAG: hypothetical protein NZ742_11825, partial [Acidobacteria bacterium]|nr:hypothetical protein [Acidobacteriota bacterium]MDW7985367.1 hypothetical protein [Acidobacteriota bacterium]